MQITVLHESDWSEGVDCFPISAGLTILLAGNQIVVDINFKHVIVSVADASQSKTNSMNEWIRKYFFKEKHRLFDLVRCS